MKPGVALQQVQQGITEVIDELAFRLASSVSEKDLQSNLDKYEVRFASICFDLVRFGSICFDLVRFGSICFDLVRFGSIGRIRVGLGVPHLNQMERLDTIGTQNWMICIASNWKPARWPNWNVNSNFRTEGGFICWRCWLVRLLTAVSICFLHRTGSPSCQKPLCQFYVQTDPGRWSRMIWKVFRQEKMDDNGKTVPDKWLQMTTNDPSRAPKVRRIDRAARPCPVALSRNELSKLRESYWREVQSLRQQLYQKQQAEAEKDWYSPCRARESAVFGGSMLIWSCFRRFFCFLMVLDWL